MKNREIVLWTIAGFILVFVVPIIINECYKANSGYLTMWTAADMLSYYGTILAASGAVIGVFLSIQYSQKQYKEDTRHRALPYLTINKLGRKCVDPFYQAWYEDDLKSQEDETDHQNMIKDALTYKEYKHDKNYFVINNNEIYFTEKLSDNQEKNKIFDLPQEIKSELGELGDTNIYYYPYEVQNVGNGCAINLNIVFEKGTKSASTFFLSAPVNSTTYVGLLFENLYEKSIGNYKLKFFYEDIYGQKYQQIKQISVEKNNQQFIINDSHDAPQVRV